MIQDSLQTIKPEQVQDFFKHVCLAYKANDELLESRQELQRQIQKVKQAPKKWMLHKEVEELPKKVENVVKKEKRYIEYSNDLMELDSLKQKIKHLESELYRVKEEKKKVITENREQIKNIKEYIVKIKSRMDLFMKAKEHRDRRFKELERKVVRSARES